MSCLDSLGDRLRIKEVVLVGLHKRLHDPLLFPSLCESSPRPARSSLLKPQQRWRFSSGSGAINSLFQVVLLVAAGAAAFRVSSLVLVPSVLLFAGSSFWVGRRLFHWVAPSR